jgi:very-short-patch-repair endonuclease
MPQTRISPETRQKAQSHRKHLSKAEGIFWSHLRLLKTEGMRFRRQAPIGPYIVDFAWLGGRIVVELDGDNHEADARQVVHDQVRDEFLKGRGFRVLRFSNWDAIDVPEWVVGRIRETLALEVRRPHPAGPLDRPPSPQGGGEKAPAPRSE